MSENLVGQAVLENHLMEQVLIVFRLKYLGVITASPHPFPGPSVPTAPYINTQYIRNPDMDYYVLKMEYVSKMNIFGLKGWWKVV